MADALLDDLLDWLQAQANHKPKTREETARRGKLKKGTRYSALISEIGGSVNVSAFERFKLGQGEEARSE